MKRAIKFRGKCVKSGEWFYGSLAYFPDSQSAHIIPCGSCKGNDVICDFVEVCLDTVGQFTGLLDRNCKEIYEGDILQWSENGCKSNPMEVVEKYGAFGYLYYGFHSLVGNDNFTFYLKGTDSRFEIIGNIHDNPELQILK